MGLHNKPSSSDRIVVIVAIVLLIVSIALMVAGVLVEILIR